MKNLYNFKKWLLLSLVTLSFSVNVSASHLVGSYMWYTHVSGNDYILHLRYFRDCSGVSAVPSASVCYRSASLAFISQVNLPNVSVIQAPLNSCAATGVTTCNGGSYYGVEQYDYEALVSLPNQANDWIFEYEECCRNAAITTLANASAVGLYTYCTLDNLSFASNNSPQFPTPFIGLYCAGVLTNIDYSTTDADGDSIAYSLVAPEDASFSCPMTPYNCTYNPPYSPTQPMASFTPITLNSSTGLFSFTPALIQVGEVCILVEEYRNGVKIGSVKRDDQIVIVNGISNPAKIEGTVFGDYNANGVQDAGENGWPGITVVAAPYNLIATTDSTGFYSIEVIPDSYTIAIGSLPQWFNPTPASYNINVSALGQIFSNNDFALAPTANITDLSVIAPAPQFVRAGFQTSFNIIVSNEGTLPATGVLSFLHDFDYSYVSSTPVYDTYGSNYMTWNLPVIYPGQSLTYNVLMQVDSTLLTGDTLFYEAMVSTAVSDDDPLDNKWTNFQIINNSFDPNFIEVDPAGDILTDFVTNRDWLYYTIHFQNTGAVPAINVTVDNGIDYNADAGSIEFVTASHPCNFKISGIGLVEIDFNNINLPSPFVDEPNSHGYAMYRIKTKPTLLPGDYILNAASITFDANLPLNTNTVSTLVVATTPTGISNISVNNIPVSVYPNPASDEITVSLAGEHHIVFEIFDIAGKSVLKKKLSHSSEIKIKDLANGMYVYKLTSQNGEFAIGKLVKK
jgi:hypothetical protein